VEERLQSLQNQLTELYQFKGGVDATLVRLATQIEQQNKILSDLQDTLNRSKGALWILGVLASVGGTGLGVWVSKAFGKTP